MDSGDLGYVADGELFITGRQKDLIIKGGRNLYPEEVEEIVGDLPGVRKGCVAAFGVPDPETGTERLTVVAETREESPARRTTLQAAVIDRVVAALGLPPDVVVIAPPRSVLKTSSGKIRRRATRDAYLAGTLVTRRRSAFQQWARLLALTLLARLRGAVAGALGLVYAVWIGIVLAVGLPSLWAALAIAPQARTADRLLRLYCRTLLALAACRLQVEGRQHLTGIGPAVLAANHSSYVDSVVLLAALPSFPFLFVAKRELLRTPLLATIIRKAGYLFVERTVLSESVADATAVSEALRAGHSLLVFPEGTFRRTPGLLPFRLGAFKAAVESGRPVVPITIDGAREILPPDAWRPRRHPVRVTIGAPITPGGQGWLEIVRLRDLTRTAIEAAL